MCVWFCTRFFQHFFSVFYFFQLQHFFFRNVWIMHGCSFDFACVCVCLKFKVLLISLQFIIFIIALYSTYFFSHHISEYRARAHTQLLFIKFFLYIEVFCAYCSFIWLQLAFAIDSKCWIFYVNCERVTCEYECR